jgi:hypothetical protein
MLKISTRESIKSSNSTSLLKKGVYITKDDKVKKSTSINLKISLSTPRIRNNQSGNFRERCFVCAWEIFLNFDRAKRDFR